jgi:hypothetical protein
MAPGATVCEEIRAEAINFPLPEELRKLAAAAT